MAAKTSPGLIVRESAEHVLTKMSSAPKMTASGNKRRRLTPHAGVAEEVQEILPAEQNRQQHSRRPGDEDVQRDGDVGRKRAERDDHRYGGMIRRKKARRRWRLRALCRNGVRLDYEARAARRVAEAACARGAGAGAAVFVTFGRGAAVRALVVKHRSSARSTRPSGRCCGRSGRTNRA